MSTRPRYDQEFDSDDDREPGASATRPATQRHDRLEDINLDDIEEAEEDDDALWSEDDGGHRGDGSVHDDDDDEPSGAGGESRQDRLQRLANGGRPKGSASGRKRSDEQYKTFRYVCVPQGIDGRPMPKDEHVVIWGSEAVSDSSLRRELRSKSDHACMWEVTKCLAKPRKGKVGENDLKPLSTRTVSTVGPEITDEDEDDVEDHPYEDELDDDHDEYDSDDEIESIDDLSSGREIRQSRNGSDATLKMVMKMFERQQRRQEQVNRELMAKITEVRKEEAPKVDMLDRIEQIGAAAAAFQPLLEAIRGPQRESDAESIVSAIKMGFDFRSNAEGPNWKHLLGMAGMMMMGPQAMQAMATMNGGMPGGPGAALLPPGQQQLPGAAAPQQQHIPVVSGPPGGSVVEPPRPAGSPVAQPSAPQPQPSAPQPQQPQQPQPQAQAQSTEPQPPPHLAPTPPPEMFADVNSADYRKATIWRSMYIVAMANNERSMTERFWAARCYGELSPEALNAFLAAWDADPEGITIEGLESAPSVVVYLNQLITDPEVDDTTRRKMITVGFRQFLQDIVAELRSERYLGEGGSDEG